MSHMPVMDQLMTLADVWHRLTFQVTKNLPMPSDSELRPNAWPRFSIWPFRLRRGGRQ